MGLLAFILCDKRHGPASNGGISETHDMVTIVNAEGPFKPSAEAPAVRIESGPFHTLRAVPVKQPKGGIGPMFGGCYIDSSDSRFPHDYPIPLHDRFESQATYDALSR